MVARVLEFTETSVSLEYAADDVPAVKKAIRDLYGEPRELADHGTSTEIEIGGEKFAFQDEWDDPCLISNSVKGSAILREIEQAVNS